MEFQTVKISTYFFTLIRIKINKQTNKQHLRNQQKDINLRKYINMNLINFVLLINNKNNNHRHIREIKKWRTKCKIF